MKLAPRTLQCTPGSFESYPDGVLASGFQDARGRTEALRLESGVTYAMPILLEIGAGRFCLLLVRGLGSEDGQ